MDSSPFQTSAPGWGWRLNMLRALKMSASDLRGVCSNKIGFFNIYDPPLLEFCFGKGMENWQFHATLPWQWWLSSQSWKHTFVHVTAVAKIQECRRVRKLIENLFIYKIFTTVKCARHSCVTQTICELIMREGRRCDLRKREDSKVSQRWNCKNWESGKTM